MKVALMFATITILGFMVKSSVSLHNHTTTVLHYICKTFYI